jgi:hypothetical protein
MQCEDCHRLETDLRLTREALALAEAALAADHILDRREDAALPEAA